MSFDKVKTMMARPATSFVVSGAIAWALGADQPISVLGQEIPMYVASGLAGAVAVEASEIAHNWILPRIPVIQKWSRLESQILTPLLQAAIYYGILKISDPGRVSGQSQLGTSLALNTAVIGAGSAFASEYVYDAAVRPWLFPGRSPVGVRY